MSGHSHGSVYFKVFLALCFFTGLSVVADALKGVLHDRLVLVIVMAVASMKAGCVLLWFMHLKSERAWKYIILAPTTILAIGLPLALAPDIAFHYYSVDVPQSPLVDKVDVPAAADRSSNRH